MTKFIASSDEEEEDEDNEEDECVEVCHAIDDFCERNANPNKLEDLAEFHEPLEHEALVPDQIMKKKPANKQNKSII